MNDFKVTLNVAIEFADVLYYVGSGDVNLGDDLDPQVAELLLAVSEGIRNGDYLHDLVGEL